MFLELLETYHQSFCPFGVGQKGQKSLVQCLCGHLASKFYTDCLRAFQKRHCRIIVSVVIFYSSKHDSTYPSTQSYHVVVFIPSNLSIISLQTGCQISEPDERELIAAAGKVCLPAKTFLLVLLFYQHNMKKREIVQMLDKGYPTYHSESESQ